MTDLVEEYFKSKSSVLASKKERLGIELMERLTVEDSNLGSVFLLVTGGLGSAKTSVLLSIALNYINNYPKSRVFWSSCYNSPLQFTRLGPGKWNIMVMEGSGVVFRNRSTGKVIELPQTVFIDYEDAWNKAVFGKVNAIFFGDRNKWSEFLFYQRSKTEFCHNFIDEFSEVCPADTSGELWQKMRVFAMTIKELRKAKKGLYVNTQSISDIDYRSVKKIQYKLWMPNAIVSGPTRVWQSSIDNLQIDRLHGNQGYIDGDGRFGIVRFANIFPPAEEDWEAIVLKNNGSEKNETDDSASGKINS